MNWYNFAGGFLGALFGVSLLQFMFFVSPKLEKSFKQLMYGRERTKIMEQYKNKFSKRELVDTIIKKQGRGKK